MIPRIQCFYGVKLAALAVALAAVVIAAPANAKTMQDIAKAGTFNIGVIPYDVDIIRDPATGEYEGVFIEAIKHVCDRMASSSVSPSPGRWPCGRRSCCSMRLPRPSTPSWWARSCTS